MWLREGGGALCAAGEFFGDGGGLTASKGLPHPPSPPKGRGRVRENAAPVHSSNPYFNLILSDSDRLRLEVRIQKTVFLSIVGKRVNYLMDAFVFQPISKGTGQGESCTDAAT